MIIPKGTFIEMNEDVNVEVLYPDTQTDMFPYVNPITKMGNKEYDSVGFLVSTTFNDEVYYDYYSASNYWYVMKDEDIIIDKLKDQVKTSVIKSL